MANNESSGESAGNAIKVISITVSIIVLGLGGLVYVFDKQFEITKRQDEFEQRKANTDDVKALTIDRHTGTMQRMHTDCEKEKEILREKIDASHRETIDWKTKYLICQDRWELHMKVCKCKGIE